MYVKHRYIVKKGKNNYWKNKFPKMYSIFSDTNARLVGKGMNSLKRKNEKVNPINSE